jgi:hypothetical protein
MLNKTVYLDVTDPARIAAGPVSITGVYLRGEIDPYLLELPPDTEIDKILVAIDSTFEKPGNDLLQYYIWPPELNALGHKDPINLKADLICARLYFRSKVLPKAYVRRTGAIPRSINRALKIEKTLSVGTYIAKWINKLRRESVIVNRYKITYPEYELDKNLALISKEHLDLLIKYGPRIDFHLESTIDLLPNYIANQILHLRPGYIYECKKKELVPEWWSIQRPKKEFFASLTSKKQETLKPLLDGFEYLPQPFKEFLGNNPPTRKKMLTRPLELQKVKLTILEKRKTEQKRSILKRTYARLQRTA